MEITVPHAWPSTPSDAEAIQIALRERVEASGSVAPRTVAGLDVSYAGDGSGARGRLAAAAVVLDAGTLDVVEESVAVGTSDFPYVPGLFAFRELPTLVEALRGLTITPDLLVCDGYGLAHPRRFGLACHLGIITGLPTIGIAKTAFVGTHGQPGPKRGDQAPLLLDGAEVGRVLRTQDEVKPVFVSVGHRVGLDEACRHALALAPRYRLPETTRRADRLSRDRLAAL
ncbi:endonuclease V [Actinomadura oligospora]|uniref:endonuclease V n=1 Tax=Actinomadura oligospora TaxID=111804 RepID=UPI00047C55D1|nr:endonuclease V [Actinomadura oligospora]